LANELGRIGLAAAFALGTLLAFARTNYRRPEEFAYRTGATPAGARALLLEYVGEINRRK
jgi:hypothetical protein